MTRKPITLILALVLAILTAPLAAQAQQGRVPRIGIGGEPDGQLNQLREVDIRDQGISLLALAPEDYVEPPVVGHVGSDSTHGRETTRGPRHSPCGEHDE